MRTSQHGVTGIDSTTLPDVPEPGIVYRLSPAEKNDAYYRERTDRNIGWIAGEEQYGILQQSVVSIAGCGGMGGLLASILLRLGVGELRIADCEHFDRSNINRQFAATKKMVGVHKALATGNMLREIADDTTIEVYPMGVNLDSLTRFVSGSDLICDMIEFWAIGSRTMLHQEARRVQVPLLNGNSVGHRSYLFRYLHDSMTVEEATGIDLPEAMALETRTLAGISTAQDKRRVMQGIYRAFAPEIPEYRSSGSSGNADHFESRLFNEGRVSIIATNPAMAAGFVANHVLFELLRNAGAVYNHTPIPPMPGYLSFDAAIMEVRHVHGAWWT